MSHDIMEELKLAASKHGNVKRNFSISWLGFYFKVSNFFNKHTDFSAF